MRKVIVLIISLVMVTSLAFSNDTSPEKFTPKYYENAKVLRVKYTQGESYIRRSYDEGMEEATVNLPIFEKDLVGTTDGRMEIYLGRLNYMRIDLDSEVMIAKAPQLRKTDMTFRLIRGGIYLDIDGMDFEKDIEVQTPDCGVFLLRKGVYRINVKENGKTEVYVFDGAANVAGTDYNSNLRENQKIVMFDGRVKERPFYFYSSEQDGFDNWHKKRNGIVGMARYGSSRYLDAGYEDYEHELSRYGRWNYSSSYNRYIWIPYNVASDWRPYYHGRWVYNPYYGYVWTSYDTWGYFTHHYGRWHWDPVFHWHWIPGYRWSPAWVSWFWDDYYYGWCPISWWNRPVIVYGGHWHRNYHYWHGIPRRAHSTIIIRKKNLSTAGIHRVAINKSGLAKIKKTSFKFRGNAPAQKIKFSKVKVVNAKGQNVIYKRSGIVSRSKYKILKSGPALANGKGNNGANGTVFKYSGRKLTKSGNITKYSASGVSRHSIKTKNSGSHAPSLDRKHTAPVKNRNQYEPYKFKPYKPKSPVNYSNSKLKSGNTKSSPRYKSSSSYKSSSGYKSTPKYSSKSKSSSPRIKSSNTRSSSSKSSSSKVKKKNDSPYYSSGYSGRSSLHSGSKSSSYKSYKSSSSYRSSSYKSRKLPTYGSSYRSSSKRSYSSYKPKYKVSSSYKSGKSYRSSSRSSSSRSSKSSSRKSSSKSSSSSSSIKKK